MSYLNSFGASPGSSGTSFNLWAHGRHKAAVVVEGVGSFELPSLGDGYFGATIEGVGTGARYTYRFDDGDAVPDIASRWQPDGNDGPSVVVSSDYNWTDEGWQGPGTLDQVIYELHLGTFTPEGSWQAALTRLDGLKSLGVSIVQIMPISTFRGAFGWGYDATLLYAPFAPYGTPDDMRAFIDAAHAIGIGVILDVVYNHVGLGHHYQAYGERYFTEKYENEWGSSFNFDDYARGAQAVRDFIVGNAIYWIKDYHIDGLRLDAVQAMFDSSDEHIVAELTRAVRQAAAPRSAYVAVENQPQQRLMVEPPDAGGYGADAMYSDDFQHAMRVATTGHDDFYYRDYRGTPQELVSALKYGFLYQGQRSNMRDQAYGTCNLDTPAQHFLHFLENHDQVANSASGLRLAGLVSPARLRAMTALLLLGPQTPCLFQGQDFASSRPFLYFYGITGEDARTVAEGRKKSLMNFPSVTDEAMQGRLPDPSEPATFAKSKLDWMDVERNSGMLALHHDLLRLRKSDPSFSQGSTRRIDGAVLNSTSFLVRYLTPQPDGHRLLLFNIGRDLPMDVIAEPLLAPPDGFRWVAAWSSEHPEYGGSGRRPADTDHFWIFTSDCTLLFRAVVRE